MCNIKTVGNDEASNHSGQRNPTLSLKKKQKRKNNSVGRLTKKPNSEGVDSNSNNQWKQILEDVIKEPNCVEQSKNKAQQ